MIIAQMTDTHVRRKGKLLHHMINTAKRLRKAVRLLNAIEPRPDVVVATGDLVESGKRKDVNGCARSSTSSRSRSS